jgi:predicted DNA-binding protein (UPF0251 family)
MTKILTKYDIDSLLREFEVFLRHKEQSEPGIPLSVFSDILSPFETVVKYLFEKGMKYSAIGKLMHKDRQVVWTTYKRTIKKHPKEFEEQESIEIPLSRLVSDKLSVAELIVGYLKDEQHMKNSEIARLMKRDDRTIWTLYKRYKEKNER